ncbi:hypothetical protein K458DRAFT_424858 [Lentithecium fluviatile CBS 122367]|uniref:F-box domain-containing protein n=1 Tax=Lentithecium fluviatile CBS 122367 TaxID=1168545 RepID=A0A6G1IDF2_9PLEO|nr:hypothetical protein K458DRAFT_424858 [Lentithecium fluviatile CBS 122367]
MASILALPTELLDAILSDLSKANVRALRATNRRLVQETTQAFTQNLRAIRVASSDAGIQRLSNLIHDGAANELVQEVTLYRLRWVERSLNSELALITSRVVNRMHTFDCA